MGCHGLESSGFFTAQKKVRGKCVTVGKVWGFLWFFPKRKRSRPAFPSPLPLPPSPPAPAPASPSSPKSLASDLLLARRSLASRSWVRPPPPPTVPSEIEQKVCVCLRLRLRLPPPKASSASGILRLRHLLVLPVPPASAAKPSAFGKREAASVSFPSGTRLPAADRALSLTLARSVAREISDGAGWRRIPAGLRREAIGLWQEGGGLGLVPERECKIEDSLETGNHMNDTSLRSDGLPAKENGSCENTPHYGDSHDELVQMVTELKLQNEFLKSHFEGLKDLHLEEIRSQQRREVGGQEGEDVKRLNERIESLERELLQEKQTRGAAEEALKHLPVARSEADARAQELSARLAEAQQNMDQEIKEREEKYSELDSKFSRLHKRAKQRIQEVQKEKDDLEARFHEINEIAERTSSQQLAL